MLVGNYPINKGNIIFNINSKKYDAGSFSCTYIPSVPILIDGTVSDNISLTDKRITAKRIYKAASLVGLNSNDSVGINYKIINFGDELTEKERNQIAMARALASPDKFIFYDDFNPLVDKETIQIFFDELRKENRIIFLSTNMREDNIPKFSKLEIN